MPLPTTNEEPSLHSDKLIKAVFFCISAHFLFFIMAWGAKYLAATHHVIEIAFYRNLIAFLPIFAFILLAKKTYLFRTKKPRLIVLRGIIGTISLIGAFAALDYLPMTYATVTFFTSALLTPILAFLFLKEHVGIHRWSAIIIGMLGVIIISMPTGEFSILGLFIALGVACLNSTVFTLLRALKTEDPLTITFYFAAIGIIISLFFMPWIAKPILPNEIWILLAAGLCGCLGQLALASAYKYAPASFITPFGYASLFWNILADMFYWEYKIDMLSVLTGVGLILSAQMYMIYREYKNKHINNNKASA